MMSFITRLEFDSAISEIRSDIARLNAELSKLHTNEHDNAIVLAPNVELAVTRIATKVASDAAATLAKEIAPVVARVNRKVDTLANHVDQNLIDGPEMVTQFRHVAMEQMIKEDAEYVLALEGRTSTALALPYSNPGLNSVDEQIRLLHDADPKRTTIIGPYVRLGLEQ